MWQLYNLLAIVDTKLKTDNNKIKQSFEMSFDILNRQHLLYVGRNDLCYSNILAISNIGFFFCANMYSKKHLMQECLKSYIVNLQKKMEYLRIKINNCQKQN